MLEKKIDKLIDSITPALFNAGEKVPTDYNELYKIISNAVQLIKTIDTQSMACRLSYKIDDAVYDFCSHCDHFKIPMHIMHNNLNLVRSIVQEIIK